jgi:hypothetical protein
MLSALFVRLLLIFVRSHLGDQKQYRKVGLLGTMGRGDHFRWCRSQYETNA